MNHYVFIKGKCTYFGKAVTAQKNLYLRKCVYNVFRRCVYNVFIECEMDCQVLQKLVYASFNPQGH